MAKELVSNSSSVQAYEYFPEKSLLEVTWKSGEKGQYSNIDLTTYNALHNSTSKGSFIAGILKSNPLKFPYKRIGNGGNPVHFVNNPSEMMKSTKSTDRTVLLSDEKIETISSQFHQLIRQHKK